MLHKKKISAYIKELLKSYPEFDDMELHKTFIYSLEIIVEDVTNATKYWYLTHSEYLEYICRIALTLFKDIKGDKKESKY